MYKSASVYINRNDYLDLRKKDFFKSRRKRKTFIEIIRKILSFTCMILVVAGAGLLSFSIAMNTMAATTIDEVAVNEIVPDIATNLEEDIRPEKSSVSSNEMVYNNIVLDYTIPIIAIDAGHGGEDDGCMRDGASEKDINLKIAIQLKARLTNMGYQVVMMREDDTYIAIEDRVEIANYYQADIYISIHQNAYENADARGIETWFSGGELLEENRRLSQLIHRETIKSTGASQRELQDNADFKVTTQTNMPSCLIETGFLSNPEERNLLLQEEYQNKIASGIAEGIQLYLNPRTMYLTFDDGPSEGKTEIVLDILKERNIKATFFVIGESVRKYPDIARRIVEEGHVIAVHCNRHDYQELYKSADSYIEDFEEAQRAILEVTGVETKLYRFPGGSINSFNKLVNTAIMKEMSERGYIYYDWNASLEDAVSDPVAEKLLVNAEQTAMGRNKVILLAHDTVEVTVSCLEDLLNQFPEYKMEVLTEDVEPVRFR